ncbi:MAG: inositol monophosphatase [Anaplasmataceae bacterium]|nr:inositol monophosphatase [Anaplasmataceae bacterium]
MILRDGQLVELLNQMEAIGLRALAMRSEGVQKKDKKGYWDIVTKADTMSEKRVTKLIKRLFPGDGLVGEEGTFIPSRSKRIWYPDPIDGTTNYAAGSDFWGISLGLVDRGIPVFGMIHYPALKETLFTDEASVKFSCSNRPFLKSSLYIGLPLSAIRLKDALVVADIHRARETVGLFDRIRDQTRNCVTFGSFVYETLLLVTGKVDAVFHTGATPFDIAAAVPIADRAGCTVTGIFDDQEFNFRQPKIPIVMSRNPELHEELRLALKNELSRASRKQ